MNGQRSSPDKPSQEDFCQSLNLVPSPPPASPKEVPEKPQQNAKDGGSTLSSSSSVAKTRGSLDKKSYAEMAAELAALKEQIKRNDQLYDKTQRFATVIQDENDLLKLEIQDLKKGSGAAAADLRKKKQRNQELAKNMDEMEEHIKEIAKYRQEVLSGRDGTRRRTRSHTKPNPEVSEPQPSTSKTAFQQTLALMKTELEENSLVVTAGVGLHVQIKVEDESQGYPLTADQIKVEDESQGYSLTVDQIKKEKVEPLEATYTPPLQTPKKRGRGRPPKVSSCPSSQEKNNA